MIRNRFLLQCSSWLGIVAEMKATKCIDCGDEVKKGRSRCILCINRNMIALDYDAEGFEVDVTTKLPMKDGEPDYEGATHHIINCTSRQQAEQFAVRWMERDKWGAVAITPYRMEDLADRRPSPTHKVYTADTFYIETK